MSQAVDELWTVAGGLPHVDANALADAVVDGAGGPDRDRDPNYQGPHSD